MPTTLDGRHYVIGTNNRVYRSYHTTSNGRFWVTRAQNSVAWSGPVFTVRDKLGAYEQFSCVEDALDCLEEQERIDQLLGDKT